MCMASTLYSGSAKPWMAGTTPSHDVERVSLQSRRQGLWLGLGKERHRLELIAAGVAAPQIGDAVRPGLEPVRRRDRLAALRAGILVGQTIRLGSDHDASPSVICSD